MQKISIDPMTRIEGHLAVEAMVDGGVVKDAEASGTLFRGFEIFLKDRHPFDAVRITQRVCGVCPTCHATASALSIDDALGLGDQIPPNGRIVRNLILGSNLIQSHILHFYVLCALDFVDVASAADYSGQDPDLNSVKKFIARGDLAPFLPRYEGDYRLPKETNVALVAHYVQALRVRRLAHELLSVFGGKVPHSCGIVPGGVTSAVTADKIVTFLSKLNQIREFVDNVYIPDVLAVAKAYPDYLEIGSGCRNFLAYGAYDLESTSAGLMERPRLLGAGFSMGGGAAEPIDPSLISEQFAHSRYEGDGGPAGWEAKTVPQPDKKGAYSWLKAPRYDGKPMEVGPLARMYVNYLKGHESVKRLVDSVLSELSAEPSALFSVAGRHAARAIDCKVVADAMVDWVTQLKLGEAVSAELSIPDEAEGVGFTEAPRGALAHWIKIRNRKIANYQLVVPTTWNASPKDAKGQPGPIEQALIGTKVKDPENPFELARIVRSFDPCLACSVHVISAKRRRLGEYKVV